MAPYTVSRSVEDGIERVVYTPAERRFAAPILMQHGMWHGAWCWRWWQELFAEWGWESIAFSLPGHGASPERRPVRWATLGYYLRFLNVEIERLPQRPVLMGHSMGGALIQWYLKYGADNLPAAVLVAPWTSHNMQTPALLGRTARRDPLGVLLSFLTLEGTPLVRNPRRAAESLITPGALLSPEELSDRLGRESALVLLQYQPPFWRPAEHVRTPLLWLAGERDEVLPEAVERPSAAHYGADYLIIPEAGHNIMMERRYRGAAKAVDRWLARRLAAPAPGA